MAQHLIQNKEVCNIYNYIKKYNEPLCEIIDNAIAKRKFMQKNITFLMPNEELIKKMQNLKSKEAMHVLRKLILNGTLKRLSDFQGDIYNLYDEKIKNPSRLPIRPDPRFQQYEGYNNCALYLYEGTNVPVSESVNTAQQQTISKKKQVSDNYRLKKHKKIVDKYKQYVKNNFQGVNPFVAEIANILAYCKSDDEKYKEVCELMDNNAIITWFILIQLGLHENTILPNEYFKLKNVEHPDPYGEYNEAFENVPAIVNGKNWFGDTWKLSRKLLRNFSDVSLPEKIVSCYNRDYVKLLQDEIRFKYCNLKNFYWEEVIDDLQLIDWSVPEEHLVFSNEELYDQLISAEQEETLYSGPIRFVNSIYFKYRPMNRKNLMNLFEKTKSSSSNPYGNGPVYGDEGDRKLDHQSYERRGYNVGLMWNALNENEREQLREYAQISKTNNKEDITELWNNLSDEQKQCLRELSTQNTKQQEAV